VNIKTSTNINSVFSQSYHEGGDASHVTAFDASAARCTLMLRVLMDGDTSVTVQTHVVTLLRYSDVLTRKTTLSSALYRIPLQIANARSSWSSVKQLCSNQAASCRFWIVVSERRERVSMCELFFPLHAASTCIMQEGVIGLSPARSYVITTLHGMQQQVFILYKRTVRLLTRRVWLHCARGGTGWEPGRDAGSLCMVNRQVGSAEARLKQVTGQPRL
jgi:hypothetical protein